MRPLKVKSCNVVGINIFFLKIWWVLLKWLGKVFFKTIYLNIKYKINL